MRGLLSILFVAIVMSGAAHSKDIDVKETHVGQTLILDFKGNKRAVHGWRLVKADSRGLEVLDVSALGWILSSEVTKSLFHDLDTMRFRIHAKAEGQADLVFEHSYRNVRGTYLVKREKVRIIIKPGAALRKVTN